MTKISKLDNKHYFIFQHRDLVWSWSISNEELVEHKSKILPLIQKDKQSGINKIVNSFNDYDSDQFEMKVYNGCIEHSFCMKGDITEREERIHWLYIGNGEKGKFLELDELEDKELQLSYLSKSFLDSEIPNIDLISKWSNVVEEFENHTDTTEKENRIVNNILRTILHIDVLNTMLMTVGSFIKEDKIKDKRDEFMFNEIFNLNTHHIRKILQNKELSIDFNEIGYSKLLQSLETVVQSIDKLEKELYESMTLQNYIKYSFFNSWDRNIRLKLRDNKKMFSILGGVINNPMSNLNQIKTLTNYINK
jgi:hypothetical protein